MRGRWPDVSERSLGIGLDLPYGATGFVRDDRGRDVLAPRVAAYLRRASGRFGAVAAAPEWEHAFVSWQPSHRGEPRAHELFETWDRLWGEHPWPSVRGLHHTALDTGGIEPRERGPAIDLANALCERYDLRWVNEDLGLWTLGGRALPYPLAPFLTDEGLSACIRNVSDVQGRLCVPFVVEFPGFTDGFGVLVGDRDPYAFFREVVQATGSPCTLDTGHLLGARWLLGHRGEALFDGLDALPLESTFEIHLSGCSIVGDRFVDAHHGVLLDAQLELLRRLLPRCPNLRLVTFEDPRFTEQGELVAPARPNVDALRSLVTPWIAAAGVAA